MLTPDELERIRARVLRHVADMGGYSQLDTDMLALLAHLQELEAEVERRMWALGSTYRLGPGSNN